MLAGGCSQKRKGANGAEGQGVVEVTGVGDVWGWCAAMGSLGVAQVEDRRALEEGEEREKIRASSSSKSWRGRKEDREDPWGDIWQRTPCEPNAQTFWLLTASLVFHHFRIRKYRPIPFRPDLTHIWPTTVPFRASGSPPNPPPSPPGRTPDSSQLALGSQASRWAHKLGRTGPPLASTAKEVGSIHCRLRDPILSSLCATFRCGPFLNGVVSRGNMARQSRGRLS